MSGRENSIVEQANAPLEGTYKCRLVRGGPYVPVRFMVHGKRDESGALVEDEQMRCWVSGKEVRMSHAPWPYAGRHPISEEEYAFMLADQADAKANPRHDRSGDPKANPRQPVDWYGGWR